VPRAVTIALGVRTWKLAGTPPVPFTTDFNMPEAKPIRVGVAPPVVYWSSVMVVEGLSSS